MALVLKDRVKETSVSTGTGAIALDGATGAYQTFSTIGDGNITYYAIAGQTTSEWEVGYGTYTLSTNSISRDFIYSSSNSNTIVTFSAGTKDVFCTYPSEQAVYQEVDGSLKLIAGVIEVSLDGTHGTTLANTAFQAFATTNSFLQNNIQNLDSGSDASGDYVATNDVGDDTKNYVDLGINSSGFTSVSFPIYTPNSAYLYSLGDGVSNGDLFVGTGDLGDVVLHAGGFTTGDVVATIKSDTKNLLIGTTTDTGEKLQVAGDALITGATEFGSTVLLDANPTTALQAATKQYVDSQVTAGLHIHAPVRVETTGNLTATYVQGGTTFNITTITSTTTVTTSVNHGLVVNDQIWLTTTAGNGLSINTAYFVFSTPALNQLTLSLTFDGIQITGLTNAAGLTYATRANSGVGATLTNAGTQVALTVDGIALSVANRVLVRLQTNGAENGVYEVTTVGSGSTNWVLTRTADASVVIPGDPDGLGTGDYFFTQEGVLNAGDSHVLTTEPNTMIIGYTTLTYTQFSGALTYTGGTNIDVTGQTISLTGTVAPTNGGTGTATVTTGDLLYGSATDTWSKLAKGSAYQSLMMDASGTNVQWNALALNQSNAVSGTLGATNGGTGTNNYATGDMLYSSAANTIAKLSGNTSTTKQYLSQTGTGAVSTAPSWATISAADIGAGTLPATRGGTDNSSYAVGDLLYADTTTTLAKLADVATGNVLISGGVSTAPAWGKVDLASAVSGTLGIANGGTSATTANAAFNALAPSQTSNSGKYLTTDGTDTSWATVAAGGTFSAGTTGFTPSSPTSGAVTLAGTLNVANGGTGVTTAQAAMNAFAGATTSGYYLRGNGTNVVMASIVAGDVPTLNQNTTGSAGSVANSVTFNSGGAGAISGTTYNGSAAQTISYNTIGAYAATNPSGFTSNTGTVTSVSGGSYLTGGTITTSGTLAVDATTTNTASKVVARDASGNFSAGTITAALTGNVTGNVSGSSGSCTGNAATATTATSVTLASSSGTISSNVWAGGAGYPGYSYSGGNYRFGFSSSAGVIDVYADGNFYATDSSYLVLHAGNYTSYAPSLTGSGASGTWGINVTGNAATATNATTAGRIDSSVRNYSREWIEMPNYSGLYSPLNAAHFYPNNGTYGSWRIDGSRNSWKGIEFDGQQTLMMNDGAVGVHRNTGGGWRYYVEGTNFFSPGNVTAYWSDRRLKENLIPIRNESLDILSKLTTYRFNWNSKVKELELDIEVGKEEIGLIAQEVQAILPDAVVVNKSLNRINEDGTQQDYDYLTINYDKITPLLVEGVNLLRKEIEELKIEIAKLKGQK